MSIEEAFAFDEEGGDGDSGMVKFKAEFVDRALLAVPGSAGRRVSGRALLSAWRNLARGRTWRAQTAPRM